MRIIRVNNCYECPRANRKEDYCGYFGKGGGVVGIPNIIYRNIRDKTMPDWCPLEDVWGITKNLGVPNDNRI